MSDDYEIVSKKDIDALKREVAELRARPVQPPSADLMKALDRLSGHIQHLITIFEQADKSVAEAYTTHAPHDSRKVDLVIAQNEQIAQGLLTLSELVQKKHEKQQAPTPHKPTIADLLPFSDDIPPKQEVTQQPPTEPKHPIESKIPAPPKQEITQQPPTEPEAPSEPKIPEPPVAEEPAQDFPKPPPLFVNMHDEVHPPRKAPSPDDLPPPPSFDVATPPATQPEVVAPTQADTELVRDLAQKKPSSTEIPQMPSPPEGASVQQPPEQMPTLPPPPDLESALEPDPQPLPPQKSRKRLMRSFR